MPSTSPATIAPAETPTGARTGRRPLALAVTGLATAATALGLAAAPSLALQPLGAASSAEPEQHRERGVVLECRGTVAGHDAYVELYENRPFGNSVQVVLGEGGPRRAGHAAPDDVLSAGKVRARVRVGGKPFVVTGTARRVGAPVPVHETYLDDGKRIVADGTHRRLRDDVRVTYRGRTTPVDCDPAFAYDLTVTTTDLEQE